MSSAPGFLICYFLEIFFNIQGEKNEGMLKYTTKMIQVPN